MGRNEPTRPNRWSVAIALTVVIPGGFALATLLFGPDNGAEGTVVVIAITLVLAIFTFLFTAFVAPRLRR